MDSTLLARFLSTCVRLALTATLAAPAAAAAEPVRVRHVEGVLHGFLALRALDGTHLADGDLLQTSRRGVVTTRLVFRFKDGSVHDETAVFTQRGHFRLLRDRLVQKGPAFPRPIDMSLDATTGDVVVRYADDGEPKTARDRVAPTADLCNGIILTLLKNVRAAAPPKSLSMVAATPEPRVVGLRISSAGRERFSTGHVARTATHYVLAVHIGGWSGLLARLVGKQPPDSHVWIADGEVPAVLKSEAPLYAGGPVWRIELVSPEWPAGP